MGAVADTLAAAAELIGRGWTQGDDARDEKGRDVAPTDPTAVCWCAWGAIDAVASDFNVAHNARETLRLVTGGSVSVWNDKRDRTQAEVIDAFKRAAELARAGEQ